MWKSTFVNRGTISIDSRKSVSYSNGYFCSCFCILLSMAERSVRYSHRGCQAPYMLSFKKWFFIRTLWQNLKHEKHQRESAKFKHAFYQNNLFLKLYLGQYLLLTSFLLFNIVSLEFWNLIQYNIYSYLISFFL